MRQLSVITLVCIALTACGRSGESGEDDAVSVCCDEFTDIRGSVTSKSLAGVSLENWILLLIERDTGTARAAILGPGGLFLLQRVKTSSPHTLALLSADYVLQSVASFPSDQPGFVSQYFSFNRRYLGNVIHDGPILTLENPENVTLELNVASDGDGDGLPDGTIQLGAKTTVGGNGQPLPLDISYVDSDFDGLVNSLDHDDDNDGVVDMAESDANGDGIDDRDQGLSDMHFVEGVESIAVQYEYSPGASGAKAYMTFTAKLSDDLNPFAVQLAGPPRLLDGASYEAIDNTGQPVDAAWNRRLEDDGFSQDELPNDRVFAKKIRLALPTLRPKKNEVFLIQLLFGSEQSPWAYSYPLSFPEINVGSIKATYNTATQVVTLSGAPFGTITSCEWTVLLSDTDGALLWSSQSIDAGQKTFKIPDAQLTSGRSLQLSISARLPDRVRANPSYVVHSPQISVNIP